MSQVAASPLIPVEEQPVSADQVWMLGQLLRANWTPGSSPVSVSTAWITSVKHAQSAAEHRWGQLGRPFRMIKADQLDFQPAVYQSIRRRMAICRSLVPLYSDHVQLSQPVIAGASQIYLDTRLYKVLRGCKDRVVPYGLYFRDR